MLYYLVVFLFAIVCLLLQLVILLQQGKGGDIANAFGGGGSQTAFGARQGATVLSRATTVLGALFMLGAMALAILSQRGTSSVVSGLEGPKPAPVSSAPAPAAPAAPTTPAATEPPPTAPPTAAPPPADAPGSVPPADAKTPPAKPPQG
ncbi:MAG: preprotein translocase subunit SecG [Vicinamibacterales bacterium]